MKCVCCASLLSLVIATLVALVESRTHFLTFAQINQSFTADDPLIVRLGDIINITCVQGYTLDLLTNSAWYKLVLHTSLFIVGSAFPLCLLFTERIPFMAKEAFDVCDITGNTREVGVCPRGLINHSILITISTLSGDLSSVIQYDPGTVYYIAITADGDPQDCMTLAFEVLEALPPDSSTTTATNASPGGATGNQGTGGISADTEPFPLVIVIAAVIAVVLIGVLTVGLILVVVCVIMKKKKKKTIQRESLIEAIELDKDDSPDSSIKPKNNQIAAEIGRQPAKLEKKDIGQPQQQQQQPDKKSKRMVPKAPTPEVEINVKNDNVSYKVAAAARPNNKKDTDPKKTHKQGQSTGSSKQPRPKEATTDKKSSGVMKESSSKQQQQKQESKYKAAGEISTDHGGPKIGGKGNVKSDNKQHHGNSVGAAVEMSIGTTNSSPKLTSRKSQGGRIVSDGPLRKPPPPPPTSKLNPSSSVPATKPSQASNSSKHGRLPPPVPVTQSLPPKKPSSLTAGNSNNKNSRQPR